MESSLDNDDRRDQFVALFVRHEAAIHSFVLTLLPDLDEAEDIVQQASLTMWRKFDDYTPGTSFRNWAFQVAKFTAMNHMTKLRRDRHVFHESLLELLADRAAERSEQLEQQRRALAFCIERLDEDDRQLLAGCYAEAATIRGVAAELGRTANAVYKHLHRLRTALQKCVELRLGTDGSSADALGAEGAS
jgi:RNA polymerase sigma-70 factor (ECF subfamily)